MDLSVAVVLLPTTAMVLAVLTIWPIRRLAWRVGLIDRPQQGTHKSHVRPTPYGGGIVIWATTLAMVLPVLGHGAAGRLLLDPARLLLGSATVVFLIGLTDDWHSLPPLPRLLIQLAATSALVFSGSQFRLPLFEAWPAVAGALTVLWIVALTNAFNFLDNMDGLSAGISAIALAVLAGMGLFADQLPCALFCLILAGACAGFLFYNFPPATLFLGDAGGLFLGFLVSSIAVFLSAQLDRSGVGLPRQVAPLLVLAVPVYDLVSVSLIRLFNRIPPWIGDQNHISHRLVRLGLSRRNAVLIIYAAVLSSGLLSFLILRTSGPRAWLLSFFLLTTAVAVGGVELAARRRQGVP